MKMVPLLAIAALGFTSISLMAQQVNASANSRQSVSATAGQAQVNGSSEMNANGSLNGSHASANGSAQSSAAGEAAMRPVDFRPVRGELEKRLDAKKARPGDPVIVRTLEKMRTADGVELPKGTRLIGHVTEAQAHTRGHADSALGIAFDHAELRKGETVPIHSMIESVSPPPNSGAIAAMAQESANGAAGGGMTAGPATGGGDLGGATLLNGSGAALGMGAGVVSGAVQNTAAATDQGLDATAHSASGAAGNVAGSSGGLLRGQADGALSASGALAAHATGIPGVMLSGDATGAAAGVLTATGRNVQLESGTQMVLGVAAAAK